MDLLRSSEDQINMDKRNDGESFLLNTSISIRFIPPLLDFAEQFVF